MSSLNLCVRSEVQYRDGGNLGGEELPSTCNVLCFVVHFHFMVIIPLSIDGNTS